MKHLKILLIVTVIGMTLMGVGYATWTDEVVISGRVTIAEVGEPEIVEIKILVSGKVYTDSKGIIDNIEKGTGEGIVKGKIIYKLSTDVEMEKELDFTIKMNGEIKEFVLGDNIIIFEEYHHGNQTMEYRIEKLAD